MRTIQLTDKQGKKLIAMIDRKNAYHDAIRKHGPASPQAIEIRKMIEGKDKVLNDDPERERPIN